MHKPLIHRQTPAKVSNRDADKETGDLINSWWRFMKSIPVFILSILLASPIALAQFVQRDQVVTPSLDPTHISSTAAAAGWREGTVFGFHYQVQDAAGDGKDAESSRIDHWARELMLATTWNWLAVEIGHSPGVTHRYAYHNDGFKQEVTNLGEIAHLSVKVGEFLTAGHTIFQQKAVTRLAISVSGTDFNANEELVVKGSGNSFSLSPTDWFYLSMGLNRYRYSDESSGNNALEREELLVGLAFLTGEKGGIQTRTEYANSHLEKRRDTERGIHLPDVLNENLSFEWKWSDYLLHANVDHRKQKQWTFQGNRNADRLLIRTSYRLGLIYAKQTGPLFGVYLRSTEQKDTFDTESETLTFHQNGQGYEVRIGLVF